LAEISLLLSVMCALCPLRKWAGPLPTSNRRIFLGQRQGYFVPAGRDGEERGKGFLSLPRWRGGSTTAPLKDQIPNHLQQPFIPQPLAPTPPIRQNSKSRPRQNRANFAPRSRQDRAKFAQTPHPIPDLRSTLTQRNVNALSAPSL